MRILRMAGCSLVLAAAASIHLVSQSPIPPATSVLYEGGRLILGDGGTPVEDGAFLVQNGRITALGKKGALRTPSGTTRVDLTGKTIMPAMINVHTHLGYEKFTKAEGESLPENFNQANLVDHLQREAFYGIGTANDGGSAPVAFSLQFQQDQVARKFPLTAQYVFNAGIVPPNGGPDSILIKGTRPLNANYEVVRSPEARAAVHDVAAKGIPRIKVWLGERGGSYPAMPREVWEAVIDEAHKAGIKVHSHATTVRDQKEAIRAGVDVIVHMVGGARVDEELLALIREKKPYWATVMALGERSGICDRDPFFEQSMSAAIIADIQAKNCAPNPNAATRAEILNYNFMRMINAGMQVVLGSDTGVRPGNAYGSGDHVEIANWVHLGLPPAQAIVAATSRAAEMLGLKDVGMLAVGKQADFLVLNANPLDDIRNTRQISSVYLRGVLLDRSALLAKWKQVD